MKFLWLPSFISTGKILVRFLIKQTRFMSMYTINNMTVNWLKSRGKMFLEIEIILSSWTFLTLIFKIPNEKQILNGNFHSTAVLERQNKVFEIPFMVVLESIPWQVHYPCSCVNNRSIYRKILYHSNLDSKFYHYCNAVYLCGFYKLNL